MKKITIGEKIRKIRKEKGLMQYQLAEKAGTSALTIVRIENNQVKPIKATLKVIADALGVSVDVLKGEE